METRRCVECGYKLDDGYTPKDIFCGACFNEMLNKPCEECGAIAGEECLAHCTALESVSNN